MKNKFEELKKYFKRYTDRFNLGNEEDQKNIQLKIDHSKRVVKNMEEIIAETSMTDEEKYLARIIALYHDIGRFKQYQEYKTFSDYKSVDHGELGGKVIKENNLIKNLNERQQNIIYKAIKQHNKADLSPDYFINEAELFFTQLIRDADKLDIFNIFVERYKTNSQQDYVIKLSTKPKISDEIYNKVIKGESINYDKLKTINDLKMMQLGWIYDLNFKKSLEIIKKRKYIETIYHSMDPSKEANDIYQQLINYIN
ncbi:MAG: HD domain-containing protein [Halanaerobiales bacterium]|nr:HD domain-containing protein [Halanaerobiales bacterium]